jgi:ATP-dependent Lon protease
MFLALYTRFMDCKMRDDTAVTGYFSLAGTVGSINRVNSKIRGAKNAGYRRVVIPASNLGNVDAGLISDPNLVIIGVSNVWELLNHCLTDGYSKSSA